MGWTTSTQWRNKAEIIADRVRTQTWKQADHDVTDTVIAHCVRGICLWKVHERNTGGKVRRYIGLDLIKNFGKDEGFGYKDMDESVQPYYYDCPLKYLDMVPEVSSQEWRDEVTKYHARRGIALKAGLIVGLKDCIIPAAQLTRPDQRRGWWQCKARDGREFRIKRGHLSGATFETWPETA